MGRQMLVIYVDLFLNPTAELYDIEKSDRRNIRTIAKNVLKMSNEANAKLWQDFVDGDNTAFCADLRVVNGNIKVKACEALDLPERSD